jgi:hypothetical protein
MNIDSNKSSDVVVEETVIGKKDNLYDCNILEEGGYLLEDHKNNVIYGEKMEREDIGYKNVEPHNWAEEYLEQGKPIYYISFLLCFNHCLNYCFKCKRNLD